MSKKPMPKMTAQSAERRAKLLNLMVPAGSPVSYECQTNEEGHGRVVQLVQTQGRNGQPAEQRMVAVAS